MFGAMLGRVPAAPTKDPYSLVPRFAAVTGGATCALFPDWDNPNGKTPVLLSSLTGTTKVFICAGQSLFTNCIDTTYTVSNPTKVLNFSITNGGLYQGKDPWMGCTGYHPNLPGNPWPTGHFVGHLGDTIYTNKTFNTIWVPIGVGGSNVLDWPTGGGNNDRITVTANRLAAAGITPTAFLWEQGESNNNGTTQATYAAALSGLISTVRGQWANLPIFIAKASYINGTTSSAVRAAQAAAVDNSSFIYAGPDADSLGSTYRQTDNTHWNGSTGRAAISGLWYNSLNGVVI